MSLDTINNDILKRSIVYDSKIKDCEDVCCGNEKEKKIKELETKVKQLETKIQHLSWVARIQSLS